VNLDALQRFNTAFLFGTDAQQWYERLRDRTGFVVVPSEAVGNATTIGTGVGPRRPQGSLITVSYSSPRTPNRRCSRSSLERESVGEARSNQTLTVETDVTVGSYETTYEREVQTRANGNYNVTVPYASEYRVAGESVTVTETDVQNGTRVTVK
jgi:hypothetical protein